MSESDPSNTMKALKTQLILKPASTEDEDEHAD